MIGAGSVVTRDITKNTIAVGSPCKILREISPSDSVLLNEKLVWLLNKVLIFNYESQDFIIFDL